MNLSEFHFIRPYWLLALLPYLVVIFLLIRQRLSQGNWSAVCDVQLLPYVLETKAVKHSRWPLWSGAIGGLLVISALAGPTWERVPAPVFRNDSALVIMLDLSRTMAAADIKPNRLAMARFKISDILKQRKDGQTALIAYADDAFTVTPLTTDTDTIDNQLSALSPEIMPADGNNTARALTKAVELLKQAGLQKGRILLVTDGGGIDDGIEIAKNLGDYQLSVLGVGTADGAPIALPDGGFMKDDNGNIVVDKMDAAGLEKLAHVGGGSYRALTSDDSDISALLSSVSEKLKGKADEKNANMFLEQWNDKGPWLLLAVLPLAALSFRKGIFGILLLIFLPMPKNSYALDLNWQDLWQSKDQQAQEAYKHGDYGKAAELFQNPDWKEIAKYQVDKLTEGDMKEPSTALGYYNQGTIFAKSGESSYGKKELEKAIQDYEKSIAKYAKALTKEPKEDLKQDIKTNQGIVSKELERLKKELEKQKQDQKQQDQNQQNQDKKDDKNKQDEQKQQDQKSDQNKPSEQNQSSDKNGEDQQKSEEQKQSEQKPEQKPEQSQDELEKQAEQQKAENNKKPEDKQQAQPDQAQQNDKKEDDKKANAAQAVPAEMSKEEQQAREQWLNRIPDDPAGLLRRKFKYQYDRRGQQ